MRTLKSILGVSAVFLTSTLSADVVAEHAFSHPAGWHTASDIARIRAQIASGKEPWATAYQTLMNDTSLPLDYQPAPVAVVHRDCCNPHPNSSGASNFERDGIACYYQMVKWMATDDIEYASAAQRIIDAWSGMLEGFAGHDQMLAAGIYGSHMAQAAELLAHAKPTWPLKARAQSMFRDVIHPVCCYFCGRSSTGPPQPSPQTCEHGANGNWDTGCMSGVAAWAVFLDNRTMLQSVYDYYVAGRGNGRLTNYIINPTGQCQESGRDQGHTQDGIEHLTETALTLYNAINVLDVFTMADRRLLAGLEYTAKYNLNYSVPFTPNCGAYPKSGWCFKHISDISRGHFSAMWEMAAGIYGPQATYSNMVVTQSGYRPEGAHPPIIHGGAHVGDGPPGLGTLTFYGMSPIVPQPH
eukprot:m.22826 g.22826  ORF g.22826 m.22826 type:complete len:411 (-) comp12809_c0_seq3:321-1553(-)